MKHRCETCTRKNCADRTEAGVGRTLILCADYTEKNETNADRIRAMTDEELASYLDVCPFEHCPSTDCVECVLSWLKQPAEDDYD